MQQLNFMYQLDGCSSTNDEKRKEKNTAARRKTEFTVGN